MAVNLPPPDPSLLRPVAGVRLGVAEAGIRKKDRRDLLVVEIADGSRVAGVFTRNRYCAAPVTVCRGATIGAGSTISRDAPADALTVSRARQTTVKGWKRPQKKTEKK